LSQQLPEGTIGERNVKIKTPSERQLQRGISCSITFSASFIFLGRRNLASNGKIIRGKNILINVIPLAVVVQVEFRRLLRAALQEQAKSVPFTFPICRDRCRAERRWRNTIMASAAT
jgi:hypothetical protein